MLSVVMIVKNEEALLKKCLDSVKEADEIIIVDTGSTDRTLEIAKQYTDKIFHFKWVDSFYKARNFAASHATQEWILTIDADQYLRTPLKEVKDILIKTNAKALNIKEISERGDWHYFPRLYKRGWAEWKGDIHNYLSKPAQGNTNIEIIYGYSPAHKKDPDRALRIAKKVVEENPSLVRERYYLAREYYYRRQWQEAIDEIDRYLKVAKWRPEINDAWLMRARCLAEQRKWGEAVDSAWQAIKYNANFKEALDFISKHMDPGNATKWREFKSLANNEDVLFVRENELPMSMNKVHVEHFKSLLNKQDISVLEWGGGYSSKYFPEYMKEKGIKYTWKVIENDPSWASMIAAWKVENLSLVLADKDSKDYLEPIGKFDLIYIDGRNRAKCLIYARKILKENGVILLHDAERERYQAAMKKYKGTLIGLDMRNLDNHVPRLWQGMI